jgi:hypothetical protein
MVDLLGDFEVELFLQRRRIAHRLARGERGEGVVAHRLRVAEGFLVDSREFRVDGFRWPESHYIQRYLYIWVFLVIHIVNIVSYASENQCLRLLRSPFFIGNVTVPYSQMLSYRVIYKTVWGILSVHFKLKIREPQPRFKVHTRS